MIRRINELIALCMIWGDWPELAGKSSYKTRYASFAVKCHFDFYVAFVAGHTDPSVPRSGCRGEKSPVLFVTVRGLYASSWWHEGCVSWMSCEYLPPLLIPTKAAFWLRKHFIIARCILQGRCGFRHRTRFWHCFRLQRGHWRLPPVPALINQARSLHVLAACSLHCCSCLLAAQPIEVFPRRSISFDSTFKNSSYLSKRFSFFFFDQPQCRLVCAQPYLCLLESALLRECSSRYCGDTSHSTIAASTSLSVSSFKVKILSQAERTHQSNSFEEINCCRSHPVHQCSPSGCLTEFPEQLSLLCPFPPYSL